MVDIKKIKEYINSKSEMINIEEVFSMFQVPEEDKIRWQILEMVVNHQNIILMRKANEVNQMKQVDAIITKKIKENGDFQACIVSCPIPKPIMKTESIANESIQMYIDLINEGIKISEIVEDISNNSNSQEIIAGILLVYLGELKIYRELLKNEEENNKEDITYEIKRIISIVNEIKECSAMKEIDSDEEEIITKTNYQIAFYRSPSGKNSLFSDLQSLDESSYDCFQTLLESLLAGKLMSYKKFHNDINLRGLKEVKLNKCRIAFMIENGYLILFGAFVKKADVDYVVYNNIAKRIALFKHNSEKMLKDYDETKTIEELNSIIEYLKENKRVWGK